MGRVLVLIQVRRATPAADKHTPHNKETTETETKNAAARGVAAEPLGDHPRAHRRSILFFLSDFACFCFCCRAWFSAFSCQGSVCIKFTRPRTFVRGLFYWSVLYGKERKSTDFGWITSECVREMYIQKLFLLCYTADCKNTDSAQREGVI